MPGTFRALTGAPLLPSALLLLAALSAVLFSGIKQSARFAIAFTAIEVLGLVFAILLGIPYLGSVNLLELSTNEL